ncbi:unnamed protein product [Owenia fusiformis]|uniref:Uncharacterized protein n=1 Tax=Owenia fusiformis TaxID=6347 RepID=A0A8J1U229_OWEFU|nr:unnamed protein product [Owenia fusiformis]
MMQLLVRKLRRELDCRLHILAVCILGVTFLYLITRWLAVSNNPNVAITNQFLPFDETNYVIENDNGDIDDDTDINGDTIPKDKYDFYRTQDSVSDTDPNDYVWSDFAYIYRLKQGGSVLSNRDDQEMLADCEGIHTIQELDREQYCGIERTLGRINGRTIVMKQTTHINATTIKHCIGPLKNTDKTVKQFKAHAVFKLLYEILINFELQKITPYVVQPLGYCIPGHYTIQDIFNDKVPLDKITGIKIVQNFINDIDSDTSLIDVPQGSKDEELWQWYLNYAYTITRLLTQLETFNKGPVLLWDMQHRSKWGRNQDNVIKMISLESLMIEDPLCAKKQQPVKKDPTQRHLYLPMGHLTEYCAAMKLQCDQVTNICNGFNSRQNVDDILKPYLIKLLEDLQYVPDKDDASSDVDEVAAYISDLVIEINNYELSTKDILLRLQSTIEVAKTFGNKDIFTAFDDF